MGANRTISSTISHKYRELEDFSLARELFYTCRDNPGLALMISYGLVTLTGLLYTYSFYTLNFYIAVLPLITLEDILLVGVRQPLIIAIFIGLVGVQLLTDNLIRWQARTMKKLMQRKDGMIKKMARYLLWVPKKQTSILMGYSFILIVFNMLVFKLANYEANQIRTDKTAQTLKITLENQDPVKLILLGNLSNFVIFYDPTQKQAVYYHHEAVRKIQRSKADQ